MRWIGVAFAIGVAAVTLANVAWRDAAPVGAGESIGEASRAELERVLRESGAGEAAKP